MSNTNQAPIILPAPLQLVHEGETLGFTVRSIDQDNDQVQLSLVRDASTPEGVQFNGNTGAFEWTPGANTVNNLNSTDGTFNFTFAANDGQVTTLSTVQVRVLDVNNPPQIWSSSHALLVGQSFSLPVIKGPAPANTNVAVAGLLLNDADAIGQTQAQTQALTIAFDNLPDGATYDAQNGK